MYEFWGLICLSYLNNFNIISYKNNKYDLVSSIFGRISFMESYLSFQAINLSCLLTIQGVNNSFLSFSPNFVQIVEQKLKFSMS